MMMMMIAAVESVNCRHTYAGINHRTPASIHCAIDCERSTAVDEIPHVTEDSGAASDVVDIARCRVDGGVFHMRPRTRCGWNTVNIRSITYNFILFIASYMSFAI